MTSKDVVYGHREPRIATAPLRPLTPETSWGFAVITFARDVLEAPLLPWQEEAVIRMGELKEDGTPRFRIAIVIVSRQSGKTHLSAVLALFWLFVQMVPMVLGTSSKLETAKETWQRAVAMAKAVEELREEIPRNGGIRRANGEVTLWRATPEEVDLEGGSRFRIAAANEDGGRGFTVHRLILDELRQHKDYSAHDASVPALNAVPGGFVLGLTNAGTESSTVLNDYRGVAVGDIEKVARGEEPDDDRLCLLEWSAPDGSEPDDLDALLHSCPGIGHLIPADIVVGQGRAAKAAGGAKLVGFLVEIMCMSVPKDNPAFDATAWAACHRPGEFTDAMRRNTVAVVDVSMDGLHATLSVGAVEESGAVRVAVYRAWEGRDCVTELMEQLPGLVEHIDPIKLGWFPYGPGAQLAPMMKQLTESRRKVRRSMLPSKADVVTEGVVELKTHLSAVIMSFDAQMRAGAISHSGDPLLTDQTLKAEKLERLESWIITRKTGHVDATYTAAGVVWLARNTEPVRKAKSAKARIF